MSNKKLKLYISDSSPDGTHDLLIVNNDFEIIDCCSEAVFGAPFKYRDNSGNMTGVFDGFDSITDVSETDIEDNIASLVAPVSIKQVLSHIAVSPVSDGTETIEFLKKYNLIPLKKFA